MLESFFILSLGITFVLVLFLVYHFKQRLTILENKCDTTFEIINNVVSELGNIRGAFRIGGAAQIPAPTQPRPENAKINVAISDDDGDVSDYDDEGSSDDDGDDEESSDDEDSDGDDEESSDDDENEDSDGGGHGAHDAVHDVEESGEDEDSDVVHDVVESGDDDEHVNSAPNDDSNTIRIINLDNQQEFDIIETLDDLNAETGNRDDQVDDDSSHIENMEEIQLHVEKLPTGEHHLDDSSITSSLAESKNNSHIYRKMTLPVLKAYVIEKGLTSEPSRMKKQELINLIESSDI